MAVLLKMFLPYFRTYGIVFPEKISFLANDELVEYSKNINVSLSKKNFKAQYFHASLKENLYH